MKDLEIDATKDMIDSYRSMKIGQNEMKECASFLDRQDFSLIL